MEVDLERRMRGIGQALFAPADLVCKQVAGDGNTVFARESRKCLTGTGVDQFDLNLAAFCTRRVDVQFGGTASDAF